LKRFKHHLKNINDTFQKLDWQYNLSRAYLVGGGLRDLLLGRLVCDYDLALPGAKETANKIGSDKRHRLVTLSDKQGQSCYRILVNRWDGPVVLPEDVIYSSKKVPDNLGISIDLTELYNKNIYQDLNRRDFTVNAMALTFNALINYLKSDFKLEILHGKIIDPHCGLNDLNNGALKAVSNSIFKDDPARLWRLWRIAAEIGFEPEPFMLDLVKEDSHLCRFVAGERVHEEIFSLLEQTNSALYLKQAAKYGLLENQFPVMRPLRNCNQGIYNNDDVFTHSLAALAALENILSNMEEYFGDQEQRKLVEEWIAVKSNLAVLKLSALFHDVGKPQVRTEGFKGKVHFYNHENIALPLLEDLAAEIRLSNREKTLLLFLVKRHLQIHDVIVKANRQTKIRFLRKHRLDTIGLTLLGIADYLSKNRSQSDLDRKKVYLEQQIPEFLDLWLCKVEPIMQEKPFLTGEDIKEHFNIKEGPLVGFIKQKVWEAQQDEKIKSREEAWLFADKLYERNFGQW